MPDERFMRHHYGAGNYTPPDDGKPFTREEKIARVQLMCTEGFCNISQRDKEAIREVLHLMLDAVAANRGEFEGHKLTVERLKAFEVALVDLYDNMGGHNHWDAQGNSGRTCPVCIQQNQARDRVRNLVHSLQSPNLPYHWRISSEKEPE